ncbi:MAG: hypothetical protein EVA81_07700 [Proteobacteria bacterium]|nr:MAG: hypothetical protein EVA81_07700 [Pseudomonadota bacterium]
MEKIFVYLIVIMLIGCSNGNKNQIQVHTSIHELSVNKESDGYTNKPSKSSGYGLRYILQNQWGVGFYSNETTRTQSVDKLSKEIYDIEKNNVVDVSYTFGTKNLDYYLSLGYGLVISGSRNLDYSQISGLSAEKSDAKMGILDLDLMGGTSMMYDFGYQFWSSGIALNFGYRKQNAKYDQPGNSTSTSNFITGNNSQYLIGLSLIY